MKSEKDENVAECNCKTGKEVDPNVRKTMELIHPEVTEDIKNQTITEIELFK